MAQVTTRTRHRRAWVRIFLGGLVLWLASVLVTFVTENSNLVPTVILVGSFLVPVTFVAYAFEHRASDTLTEQTIFVGFVYGGILGVLGASLLEAAFLGQQSLASYVGVGLIEEGCKLAVLWFIARRLPEYLTRDGVVLGAAVGFGFAAFETAGYAFNALFTIKGLSLTSLVETQFLRGILVIWYVVVSLLHAFWDASGGIAALVVMLLTANSMQQQLLELGRVPSPTPLQVQLFTIVSISLLVLDAIVGIVFFVGRWRSSDPLPAMG